jgi:hypothetical protein
MEMKYKLLWQTKHRQLLREAERERMGNALHVRPSFGTRAWSVIGVAAVVLVVLLQVT